MKTDTGSECWSMSSMWITSAAGNVLEIGNPIVKTLPLEQLHIIAEPGKRYMVTVVEVDVLGHVVKAVT